MLQMVEQAFALRDVMRPGHGLDAAAGLAAFAAVEQDAGEVLRQMIEQLDLGVDALRRPGLDHRVEAARRVHQDRRAGADDLIARRDAVDVDARHGQPLIWRPARASAISAAKASSVGLGGVEIGVGLGSRAISRRSRWRCARAARGRRARAAAEAADHRDFHRRDDGGAGDRAGIGEIEQARAGVFEKLRLVDESCRRFARSPARRRILRAIGNAVFGRGLRRQAELREHRDARAPARAPRREIPPRHRP